MSDIFIKRVGKLLDGLPTHGYSESRKPIRASASERNSIRKEGKSEFELHNKVLQNTWGRIEFEIEPLNQTPLSNQGSLTTTKLSEEKADADYKVRVRTRHGIVPPQILNSSPVNANIVARGCASLKAISNKDICGKAVDPLFEQDRARRAKSDLEEKYQSAKRMIRKEFACRESRRMFTLINERKAQAAVLQEKNVFVNFALPVLETLAKSSETTKSSLKWLAFHENPNIRKAVAKNKNTDLEILEILTRDENESVRMAAAANPLVDKEFLLKLLNGGQNAMAKKAQDMLLEMSRSQAIRSNQATLSALKDCVADGELNKTNAPKEADFMQVVAARDTTPPHHLSQLSKHYDWNVRLAVANNPHTTVRTLSVLSLDPVPSVRAKAVFNPNCPTEIRLQAQENGLG